MDSGENAIELDDLRLSLGGRTVLTHISLNIPAGQFIGVLGPNGAGKTTLMRAILGLVAPASGSLRVLGRPATRGNPMIGYIPQLHGATQGLHLSGWDFVAVTAKGHCLGLPVTGKAERADIERALDLVGARDLARRPLGEMSGGERQRLLLAQALIGAPRLLLLDEPLISLDPHRQQEVVALVKSLQRDLGITILFSAHELNPLLEAIDKVLYLGSGQAALGTVDEVITGPILSRLYSADIEVVRLKGRIFVMSGGHDMEHEAHRHDHDDGHGHAHDHGPDHGHETHHSHADHL
ncbi:MAG: ATP-binding cassette domain-containing protein [Methylovirgula sp.]